MAYEKVLRETERLVRTVNFFHEMAADHRQIRTDTNLVKETQSRLTSDEFIELVATLALLVQPAEAMEYMMLGKPKQGEKD